MPGHARSAHGMRPAFQGRGLVSLGLELGRFVPGVWGPSLQQGWWVSGRPCLFASSCSSGEEPIEEEQII
jgi:hypothetical protein